MKRNRTYPILAILPILFALSFGSCNKTKSCPDGNLCVEGNTYEYQLKPTSAKLIIEVPEGAVYSNTAITTTDLVPSYPAHADYDDFDRHFAGGIFKIEPLDLPLKQLIKIAIEYPNEGITDAEGNNYEDNLRLWFVNDDEVWSIVPASRVDVDKNQVYAEVKKLGIYAVAAEKECIVGEWHQGDTTATYPYQQRVIFNVNNNGVREYIMECGPDDWRVSKETFKWDFYMGQLKMYGFTARNFCDTSIVTPLTLINYYCTGPTLLLEDLPSVTYSRYY